MFDEILRESKSVVRSSTYLIFIIAIAAMFFFEYRENVKYDLNQAREGILFEETRWGGTKNNPLVMPVPGADGYGSIDAEEPEQVMKNTAYRLFRDFSNNSYDTYIFGVIRADKKLKPEDRKKVHDIFKKITGKTPEQVDEEFNKMDLEKIMQSRKITEEQASDYLKKSYYKELKNEFKPGSKVTLLYNYEKYMPINTDLTYNEFKIQIKELRSIIGRKTLGYENLEKYGERPRTYDTAEKSFEAFIHKDKISRAYARLFCDNIGIILGIAPALIAAEIVLRGIRKRKEDLRHEPDKNQPWVQFFSVSAVSFIPVLVLAAVASIGLGAGVKPLGLSIDGFAFIGYSIVWLLPAVMFATAAGLFLTELTERFAGVIPLILFWLWSIRYWGEDGPERILYGNNLIIRHNVVGEYDTYISSLGEILANRAAYAIIAMVLVALHWRMRVRADRKRY